MPKVVLQEDGSVVLPAETLRRNGWSPGTTFLIEETHGVMVLRPAPDQPAAPADASPAPRDADELVMLRIALGATRSQFALLLDTDLDTVRAWEEGRAFPDGEVARRVAAVAKDPEAARQRLPMTGALTIVGLGPALPHHATLEAAALLRDAAARPEVRAYGLAHVRDVVAEIAPGLQVRSLDYLYTLPAVPAPLAYRDLAELLTRRAFEDGFEVVYVVAGSPLFINDAVLFIRRRCAEAGWPLRVVHGMSFVDLVLDRVYWTGHSGLQLYSAWNVARDGVTLRTDAPALLCQLGEFTAGGDALDTDGSTTMLAELRDALLQALPPAHPVLILYSSGRPDYRSLGRVVALSELAEQTVPVYSNLWVPSLDGPPLERELAPPSDGGAP